MPDSADLWCHKLQQHVCAHPLSLETGQCASSTCELPRTPHGRRAYQGSLGERGASLLSAHQHHPRAALRLLLVSCLLCSTCFSPLPRTEKPPPASRTAQTALACGIEVWRDRCPPALETLCSKEGVSLHRCNSRNVYLESSVEHEQRRVEPAAMDDENRVSLFGSNKAGPNKPGRMWLPSPPALAGRRGGVSQVQSILRSGGEEDIGGNSRGSQVPSMSISEFVKPAEPPRSSGQFPGMSISEFLTQADPPPRATADASTSAASSHSAPSAVPSASTNPMHALNTLAAVSSATYQRTFPLESVDARTETPTLARWSVAQQQPDAARGPGQQAFASLLDQLQAHAAEQPMGAAGKREREAGKQGGRGWREREEREREREQRASLLNPYHHIDFAQRNMATLQCGVRAGARRVI